MGLFRRKTEILDAEHLIDQSPPQDPTSDPGAVQQVGEEALSPGGASADFSLTVQDVFMIKGRGVVVTGQVAAGQVSVGATVTQIRQGQLVRQVQISGVEMFRKVVDTAHAGDNVGLLLRDVAREDVTRGDVLSA